MRYISYESARHAVSVTDAVMAMERLFRDEFDSTRTPPRQVINVPGTDGLTLFMPAVNPARTQLGIKVSSIRPKNVAAPIINGAYLLLDYDSGQLRGLIDSNVITRMRTAAVSALVSKAIVGDVRGHRIAILGAGAQAEAHAEALCAALDVEAITILSRSASRADHLLHGLSNQPWSPARITRAHDLRGLLADATILCTCTSTASAHPLVYADNLPSTLLHVNAIGGSTLEAMEIDPHAYGSATPIVECVDAATSDAADIREAIAQGIVSPARLTSIGRLLRDGIDRGAGMTIYRSVGHALEDLALADLIWMRHDTHE